MKKILFLILLSKIIIAQSWVSITPTFHPEGNYDLYLSSFVDENNGWFVDHDSGSLFNTTDGGYNWLMQINGHLSIRISPKDIYFVDNKNGWMLATIPDTTILFKTTDAGENWQQFNVPEFLKIYFLDKDYGIGVGTCGIFYTTDSGLNWSKSEYEEIFPSIGFIEKLSFIDSSHGYIILSRSGWVEGERYLLLTEDSGKTWKQSMNNPPYYIQDIFYFDFKKGISSCRQNGIWLTENGGHDWSKISTQYIYKVFFKNEYEGWATNDVSGIYHSINGGISWSVDEPSTFNLGRFHYRRGVNKIYVTGLSNKIFFLDNIVSVDDSNHSTIATDFLLYQNYPNPFNPSTVISYQVPKINHVQLKVYDLLGRKVATLVDKEQSSGIYKVEFNGQHAANSVQLSAGIYFYRLTAGDFAETKKMLLMK